MTKTWMQKKRVTMNVNITIRKPGHDREFAFECSEANLNEEFTFVIDPRVNIADLRSFIISAINAMEDENPDTDENRKRVSYSDLPAHISDFSCKLWVV